ncbi:MAG: hypothetical protein ABI967_16330, partial [bacterium]
MKPIRLVSCFLMLSVVLILALISPLSSHSQKRENFEARINALLARMTLEEKLGQLQQLDGE